MENCLPLSGIARQNLTKFNPFCSQNNTKTRPHARADSYYKNNELIAKSQLWMYIQMCQQNEGILQRDNPHCLASSLV